MDECRLGDRVQWMESLHLNNEERIGKHLWAHYKRVSNNGNCLKIKQTGIKNHAGSIVGKRT